MIQLQDSAIEWEVQNISRGRLFRAHYVDPNTGEELVGSGLSKMEAEAALRRVLREREGLR
jgi:hypothetical protein